MVDGKSGERESGAGRGSHHAVRRHCIAQVALEGALDRNEHARYAEARRLSASTPASQRVHCEGHGLDLRASMLWQCFTSSPWALPASVLTRSAASRDAFGNRCGQKSAVAENSLTKGR